MADNQTNGIDPFEVRKLYKYLRVVDVVVAMDGIGYFNMPEEERAVGHRRVDRGARSF